MRYYLRLPLRFCIGFRYIPHAHCLTQWRCSAPVSLWFATIRTALGNLVWGGRCGLQPHCQDCLQTGLLISLRNNIYFIGSYFFEKFSLNLGFGSAESGVHLPRCVFHRCEANHLRPHHTICCIGWTNWFVGLLAIDFSVCVSMT